MIRFAAAAFVASLMATTAFAQTTTMPSTAPTVSGTAKAVGDAASSAATSTKNAATSAATSTKNAIVSTTKKATAAVTGQYATEAEAKAHCPTDTIVWGNPGSKAYHLTGTKFYGKTKKGSYMCMADATSSGYHAAGSHKAAATAPAAKTN
jgi:hypothetical protein